MDNSASTMSPFDSPPAPSPMVDTAPVNNPQSNVPAAVGVADLPTGGPITSSIPAATTDNNEQQSVMSPPPSPESVVVSGSGNGSSGPNVKVGKTAKVAGAVFGILLLVAGTGVGLYAIRQRQNPQRSGAAAPPNVVWCASFNCPNGDTDGNGECRDGDEGLEFLGYGDGGNCTVPVCGQIDYYCGGSPGNWDEYCGHDFSGFPDCGGGDNGGDNGAVQCSALAVFDTHWNRLTAAQLSALSAGDTVRLTVTGSATGGASADFDMARFRVNGGAWMESTTQRPGGNEYYYDYQLPSGVTTFNFEAQVHSPDYGWH